MNMNKKGMEPTSIMVGLVLAILIISLMGWIIKDTLMKGRTTLKDVQKESELNPKRCASIILGQACFDTACTTTTGYKDVPPPPGGWEDCKTPKQCCAKE